MARIVISQNITLDGVVQDPTGEEGLPGGGWFNRITAGDREAWAALSAAVEQGKAKARRQLAHLLCLQSAHTV